MIVCIVGVKLPRVLSRHWAIIWAAPSWSPTVGRSLRLRPHDRPAWRGVTTPLGVWHQQYTHNHVWSLKQYTHSCLQGAWPIEDAVICQIGLHMYKSNVLNANHLSVLSIWMRNGLIWEKYYQVTNEMYCISSQDNFRCNQLLIHCGVICAWCHFQTLVSPNLHQKHCIQNLSTSTSLKCLDVIKQIHHVIKPFIKVEIDFQQ